MTTTIVDTSDWAAGQIAFPGTPGTDYALITFGKLADDGTRLGGQLDIIDGKLDYQGDVPITDAARQLFEYFAEHCGEWWIERASKKNDGA